MRHNDPPKRKQPPCSACVDIADTGVSFIKHTCNKPILPAPREAYENDPRSS